MKSCLYLGYVRHRRHSPCRHQFRYPLFMLLLDLDELDTVFQDRWLWSVGRSNLASFRREDHFGDPATDLASCARDQVQQALGRRPEGAVQLLTHLRYLGYCFNPISLFYCFDSNGRLDALIAEVTNTPWKECRLYVIDAQAAAPNGRLKACFAKDLHVSPFMPMDLDYDWRSSLPGNTLSVHMNVRRAEAVLLDATLSMRRQPLTGSNLARVLARFPWMTFKVIFAIHWQALLLWLKRVPVFDHPPVAVNSSPPPSET